MELLSFIMYALAKKYQRPYRLKCVSADKLERDFGIDGTYLVERVSSADLFSKTVKVNRTEMARFLMESAGRPFTVEFIKVNGDTRILRGTFLSSEPLLGRSMVIDYDDNNGIKQVDHRTLKSLILNDVKYKLK